MEQVEVVDRDYEGVDRAEHDSRKRNTAKIKLTAVSKKVIDSIYAGVRKTEKKLEKVESKIKEAERKQTEDVEAQGIKGYISFIVTDIKKKILQKKKYRLKNQIEIKNRRAVRIHDKMKKSMLYKYLERLNNLDVNEIDRNSISEAVEKAFNNMSKDDNNSQSINEPEKNIEVTESDAVVNDDSLNSLIENESISEFEKPRDRNTNETDDQYNEYLKKFYSPEPEFKTNYNENVLIEGTYRLKKDEIIQDDLAFKNDFVAEKTNVESEFKAPTVIPEFQQFFDSIPKFDSISEQEKEGEPDFMSISNDNNANTVNEEIFSKVNDSLNDENITSSDLAKLREELETERNKKNKLTEELEEKMKRAAVIEKEAAAALQEQKEKMKLVRDELAAYKEENKRLETQAQKVEESTQRQISIRQQSLNYINSLNEMMGPHAVNVSVTRESSKGM